MRSFNRAIITGKNGTVGQALTTYLQTQGIEVIGWDRKQIPIDDYHVMYAFVEDAKPDVLFHLATASQPTGRENESWLVNYEWTSELAWITRQLNIKFVFTSSVMVFTDDAAGPFTVKSEPDATEGYGYEKYQAEKRTLYQNPDAIVARIGWQIGTTNTGNHMLSHLYEQAQEHGEIRASTKWYPACSFLEDTASTLLKLAKFDGGIYLVNSNKQWTYHEIAQAMKELHSADWQIVADDTFVYDQRMLDERVPIAPLEKCLSTLI
ncbi:MAG: sugar nucleotide-binding protein [Chloroflexota bacterium]